MSNDVKIEDNTVRTFTTVEDWEAAVRETGHNVKIINNEEDTTEYFAEKADEDDVTMIGYFKDDWGMIV